MPYSPNFNRKVKLPVFASKDATLAKALNLLARAIENIEIPDVRLSGGTMEWSGNSVMLRPEGGAVAAAVEDKIPPLYLVAERPAYVPIGDPVPPNHVSTWITWGVCNSRLPTNWHDRIDTEIPESNTAYYFALKVNIAPDAASLTISSCSWERVDSGDWPLDDDAWGSDGSRPEFIYIPLGVLAWTGGVMTLSNIGAGSLFVSEHLSDLIQETGVGFKFNKSINYRRIIY